MYPPPTLWRVGSRLLFCIAVGVLSVMHVGLFMTREEEPAGTLRCVDIIRNAVFFAVIALLCAVAGDALQASLLAAGLARPGPFGQGVEVDADGGLRDAQGRASDALFAIGSLRIGAEWESIAVPDLRLQAARIAARLRPASQSS
jgi:uncharacterized NAD(P)/FAD-binding protein YdhS